MNLAMILLGIVVLVVLYVVFVFNSLVQLRNRVEEAFSDIGVQQKRRHNLIPNLVETVKGYASHERGTFEAVTEARSRAINASESGDMKEMVAAENMLTGALKSIFALAENYPDLKANENFKHLQEELVDAEDKIQAARRFHNANVQTLNTKVQQFPSNIVANLFKFAEREFFENGLVQFSQGRQLYPTRGDLAFEDQPRCNCCGQSDRSGHSGISERRSLHDHRRHPFFAMTVPLHDDFVVDDHHVALPLPI